METLGWILVIVWVAGLGFWVVNKLEMFMETDETTLKNGEKSTDASVNSDSTGQQGTDGREKGGAFAECAGCDEKYGNARPFVSSRFCILEPWNE